VLTIGVQSLFMPPLKYGLVGVDGDLWSNWPFAYIHCMFVWKKLEKCVRFIRNSSCFCGCAFNDLKALLFSAWNSRCGGGRRLKKDEFFRDHCFYGCVSCRKVLFGHFIRFFERLDWTTSEFQQQPWERWMGRGSTTRNQNFIISRLRFYHLRRVKMWRKVDFWLKIVSMIWQKNGFLGPKIDFLREKVKLYFAGEYL